MLLFGEASTQCTQTKTAKVQVEVPPTMDPKLATAFSLCTDLEFFRQHCMPITDMWSDVSRSYAWFAFTMRLHRGACVALELRVCSQFQVACRSLL